MNSANLHFRWQGQVPYKEGLELQNKAALEVAASGQGCILGLEHPYVVTLGRRMSLPEDAPPEWVHTDRGGQATIHNPGQLVIYPILPLRQKGWGVKKYLDVLMSVTSEILKKCNIMVIVQENGLHTSNGKIASFGIQVRQGISRHGIAINVSNDLGVFKQISPCGVQGQPMDRVDAHVSIELQELFLWWQEAFTGHWRDSLTRMDADH